MENNDISIEIGIPECEIPSQNVLATIAAATMIKNPSEAVNLAAKLWFEAGRFLEFYDEGEKVIDATDIPQPEKFPASFGDFLKLVVTGKTIADKTKRYRDYLEECDVRWKAGDKALTPKQRREIETQAEDNAAKHIGHDKKNGFKNAQQWNSTVDFYLRWWKQTKSQKTQIGAAASVASRKAK